MEIYRSATKFLLGHTDPVLLQEWLVDHQDITGIVTVGRSNVGKSSLINAIFGNNTARVSKTPGRTQEINFFHYFLKSEKNQEYPDGFISNPLYLFDLPGHGYADVPIKLKNNWQELLDVFFANLPPGVLILNIQDVRHPMQTSDKLLLDYLKTFNHSMIMAFNKLDKLKTQKERAQLKNNMPTLLKGAKAPNQIFFVSAEKRTGLKELETSIINHSLDWIRLN